MLTDDEDWEAFCSTSSTSLSLLTSTACTVIDCFVCLLCALPRETFSSFAEIPAMISPMDLFLGDVNSLFELFVLGTP